MNRKYIYKREDGTELYVQRSYAGGYYIEGSELVEDLTFPDADAAQAYLDIYCKYGKRISYA